MPKSRPLTESLQVTVAQIGARHHYAIPRMLEKVGCLERLYTDANAARGSGKLLASLPKQLLTIGAFKKLSQRMPEGIPHERIRHTEALLRHKILTLLTRQKTRGYVDDDYLFDRIVADWGFGDADTLYAMQKHGTKMLQAAQIAGVRTVVDVFITPLAHRIVANERNLFPHLEQPDIDGVYLEIEEERTRNEIDHADLLLCPGMNVVEGLAAFPNAIGKPYALVPYGCGASFGGLRNRPVKGRVLFAGTAELRKGIHYLAMAATELRSKNYDFRVAGNVCEKMKNHSLTKDLNFLGRVPRAEMKREFLNADVFVLPTLAEGCASVVHEAVMAGCPVITTEASGTLVSDGKGGCIVPARNHEALADAIDRIITNRDYRAEMAETCKSLAEDLTEESWSGRLIAALMRQTPEKIKNAQVSVPLLRN